MCESCRTNSNPDWAARSSLLRTIWFSAILLTVVGVGLIVSGLVSGGPPEGCFVWPFPLIVACGFGSGIGGDGAGIIVIAILAAISLVGLSFFRMIRDRRRL